MTFQRKYFGTDGIRGRVGQSPITPDFVLKLGFAAGRVLAQQAPHAKILIGKDTRISGYMFESAIEAGLSAAGLNIGLLGPIPTPAVAYLTQKLGAHAGIVISASHNPYYDNGIKFFQKDGSKLPDEMEWEIEQQLEKPLVTVPSEELGKAFRVADAVESYMQFCESTFPYKNLALRGLKIVVDCANGATYQIAPTLFADLGADVVTIGDGPNGLNINEHCGATSLDRLRQTVLSEQADLGIAFDGDGDRVMLIDHTGAVTDGDDILFILARYLQEQHQLSGGVVGTLMSNFGLEMALKELGIDFVRANVGDRYVLEELRKRHWVLGGETSGHIILLNLTSTGDGIIAALQVLAAMLYFELSLSDLKADLQKLPQVLVNVRMNERIDLKANAAIQSAVQAAERQLAGKGRVLLRLSGTEPLVRVMVEGENQQRIEGIARDIAGVVEGKI